MTVEEEVEQMLLDSIAHAKDDVAQRMLIEARTEAEQMAYTADRFLAKNGQFLQEFEILQSRQLLEQLRASLNSGDKDLMLKQVEALNEYTRPFAERVMDVAIATAMKGKQID